MLCIWTFIHVGRPQDIFPFLQPFHPADIAAGLGILTYFLTNQQRPPIRSYPEVRLFILFVGLAALCTPFGYYPRKSLTFLIDFGIKLGIYLWLVAKLITTEQRINGIIKTLMISGISMAIFAISRIGIESRISGGSTYDANDLALILVTTLPIAVLQGLLSNSLRWKIIFFGSAAFNLIGIIATKSRGGFLGLVTLWIFMFFVKLPGVSKRNFVLISSILGIIFMAYIGSEYKERIHTIFEENVSDVSAGSGRIAVWKRALEIARDHPILGVGPNAIETAYGHYIEADKFSAEISTERIGGAWKTAHNSFLLVLTEMGLPGLLIFVAINIKSFRNFQRIRMLPSKDKNGHNQLSFQATTLLASLVGFLICAFFLSQSYNMLIYLCCFLSGAMIRLVFHETDKLG